jgi:V-type H+-transporting ATPase subunit H
MSLEPPSYLATLQNNVRQRPIPWDGAVRSGLVSDAQLAKIRAIDRAKNKEAKTTAIESDIESYTELFVGEAGKPSAVESAAKQPNMLQYLVVLLDDMVSCRLRPNRPTVYEEPWYTDAMATGSPSLARSILVAEDPYRSFLPLLSHSRNPEDPIPLLTAHALANIMSSARDTSPATDKALPEVLKYLSSLVDGNDTTKQDIAILQYSALLYGKAGRQQFWKMREKTITPLIEVLRSATGLNTSSSAASAWSGSTTLRTTGGESQINGGIGLQMLYHILMVLWQMSFDAEEIGDELSE